MFRFGLQAGPTGPALRVGLATANERAGGRSPLREPAALVWERDRFIHLGPIRGGHKIIRPECEANLAKGQISVGPDHVPSIAYLGSDPQLGEVRGAATPRSLVGGRMGGGPRHPHG